MISLICTQVPKINSVATSCTSSNIRDIF